jgi:hypothetical protein
MKKAISIFLVLLFVISFAALPASAADEEKAPDGAKYTAIASISAGISINGLGCATSSGSVVATSGLYTCYLVVILQRYVNGNWQQVNSWSDSDTGSVAISEPYYVSSGTYRGRSTATVYAGDPLMDNATCYSGSQTY